MKNIDAEIAKARAQGWEECRRSAQGIARDRSAQMQRDLKPIAEAKRPNVRYRIKRSEADAWQSICDRLGNLRNPYAPEEAA